MGLNRLPSNRTFRFLLCLIFVTTAFCLVIMLYKDGGLKIVSLRHVNQTLLRAFVSVDRMNFGETLGINATYNLKKGPSSSGGIVENSDINQQSLVSDKSNICYASSGSQNQIPVTNFVKYPCLKSLPIFPGNKSAHAQQVKCVRTYCYPVPNNGSGKTRARQTELCVSLKTPRGTTPICIYPPQTDIHVSGSIKRGGQWEGGLVVNLAKFIKSKPGTEFLDIGCNIGAYTISMAHLGIKVTAIDPILENLELLSKSLVLGKLQENVTLIWNAVSNTHTLVKFKAAKRNIGGTRVVDVNVMTAQNDRGYTASTVLLDDLIPLFRGKRVAIKIDIEESEYNALLGARRFLNDSEIDVAVIQIEYLFHKTGKDGPRIFSYLTSKGFTPYRDLGKRSSLKSSAMRLWPNDLYYIKT